MDRRLFSVPVIGGGWRDLTSLRFVRVLGLLLERGVSLIESVPMAGRASGSAWLAQCAREEADAMSEGKPLVEVIRGIRPLHPSLAAWVQAGEAGGDLTSLLDNAAQRFQQSWDRLASRGMLPAGNRHDPGGRAIRDAHRAGGPAAGSPDEQGDFAVIWWVYNLVFPVAFAFLLPHFIWRMIRRGGYARNFAQRFGRYGETEAARLDAPDRPIWIQAVSVGELAVAFSFMDEVRRRDSSIRFVLTTNTSTGHHLALKKIQAPDVALYFPMDVPWVMPRVLRRIRPVGRGAGGKRNVAQPDPLCPKAGDPFHHDQRTDFRAFL